MSTVVEEVPGPTTEELAEEVKSMSAVDLERLQRLASNDLYIMSKGVIGRPDVNKETHGQFCRFIQGHPKKRRLGLMPRAHLKTSIASVDDSVRLPTLDPESTRILISAETATLSEKILYEIKQHWTKNVLLRALYPHLAPEKTSGPGVIWGSNRANLQGNTSDKDVTYAAIGVGGAVIGGHFTRIKNDDLIGYGAARSPAKMEATIQWNNNIESLLVNQHLDIIDWIGTRWGRVDLYHRIMDAYGSELAVFTREAIENGQIIFPNLHTMEEYDRIQRISPDVWFAQYCNNPQSVGQVDFDINNIKNFRFSLDGNYVESEVGRRLIRYGIGELDRVLLCDPNSGHANAPDAAALVLAGVSPNGEVFTLYTWSGRPSPTEYVDKIVEIVARWRPRAVGIEKAGQQTSAHYYEKRQREVSFYLPSPTDLEPRGRRKEERIVQNLDPIIRSGDLFILPTQAELREQIANFPDTIFFDLIDALAYGPELWRLPLVDEGHLGRAVKNVRLMLSRRNTRTGY